MRLAYARVVDEPASLAFAERHGYRSGRHNVILGLDLATAVLPPAPTPPAGVRLVTAAVNAWCGYRPVAAEWRHLRTLHE